MREKLFKPKSVLLDHMGDIRNIIAVLCILSIVLLIGCTAEPTRKSVDLGTPQQNLYEAPSVKPTQRVPATPSCPRIDVPMENGVVVVMQGEGDAPTKYGEWTVQQLFYGDYISAPLSPLVCSKGRVAGERPDQIYCKNNADYGIELYLMRQVLDDGVIKEVQRRTFTNVYDESGNYLETQCGSVVRSAS